MKKYTLITFVLLGLVACEKNLELKPKDRLSYDNFFQSSEDALAAVNAIYDVLGAVDMYSSTIWLVQDLASDDCYLNPTVSDPNLLQFDQYTIQATNIYLEGMWRVAYDGINRANVLFDRVPGIDMDEDLRTRVFAEARFLRGLFYFNLVRLFGDVPLTTRPVSGTEDMYPERTAAAIVYDTLINDLRYAADHLPEGWSSASDKGRATKGAALGQLAKVYLTLQEWDLAAGACQDIMELEIYGLFDDFADAFKVKNANGKESVYEIQFFDGDPTEKSRIIITGLPSINPFPAGVGTMLPTGDLLNSFEAGDYRKEVSFFSEYTDFFFQTYEFEPHIWKHWDREEYSESETTTAAANFPLMRYPEVLLMYAEALNEANGGPTPEAYDAINRVRARARNGVDGVLPDLGGLTQAEFRDAVLMEKRHETVNEGHRWFDLVRTGNLVEFVNRAKGDRADPQAFHNLFPIPQRERDVNSKLSQNDNY